MSAKGFWDWLDRAPVEATRHEWNRRLGTNFERVTKVVLRRTERDATWTPCPDGCCGGHRLVSQPDGGFLAICNDDEPMCEDVSLTADEGREWEMDFSRLSRLVARALDLAPRDVEMDGARCRQIGTFSGAGQSVVMVLPGSTREFREALTQVFVRLREQFIVLAPTGRFMDATCHALLKSAKAGFFDLESLLGLEPDGMFRVLRSVGELFTPYLPEQGPAVTENDAARVFALMRALDGGGRIRKAPLGRVFQLLVLEGLSQEAVARECGCAPSLVSLRVGEIEARMKRPVAELRALATRLNELNNVPEDARARSIYRRGLTDEAREDD